MGNAQQLTAPVPARAGGAWRRHTLFGLGMFSLVALGVGGSLTAWIVLPMAVLNWSPSVVVSGSMRPAIEVGDVVMLRPTADGDLGVDTVVLYDGGPGAGRIMHRIVQLRPDGTYVTQGDANPTPDSAPVRPDEVRGAAVLLVPWIGKPAAWVVHRQWPAVAALAVGSLCCLRMAAFACDPAYDPWGTAGRVLPARVLLDTAVAAIPGNQAYTHSRLLAPDQHDVVVSRLAEQAAAAAARHGSLMPSLS